MTGAIFTFVFSDYLPVINLPPWLDKIIQRDAVVAVINTIGVTAIVIAWLINITNQTICKERIGVLINWAYPGFFLFYFSVFLVTVLCGVYLGNGSQRRLPIILVAFGIILGVFLIGRVSYIFLFSYKKRDRIAFTYHEAQMKNADPSALSYTMKRIIIQAANIAAEREVNCEDIHIDEIYELWKTFVTEHRKNYPPALANDMEQDCCRLARRFWEVLIPKSESPCQQEIFLNALTSGTIVRTHNTKDDLECCNYFLAGFLLMLARQHKKEEHSWESACQVLTDLLLEIKFKSSVSFQKLFWGLALIMAIDSAFNHSARFDMILELSNRLKIKEFLRKANLLDEARILDTSNNLNSLQASQAANTPEQEQAKELQPFLASLRSVFLEEFGYAGGIYIGAQKVSWENQIIFFLNEAMTEPYPKTVNDDMAVVCWLLRKELSLYGQ